MMQRCPGCRCLTSSAPEPCWECRAKCGTCLDHGKVLTQDGADECPDCSNLKEAE
jgi:hypothetical protein